MDAAVALGLDLGGTKCLGLAVDNEGEILRGSPNPDKDYFEKIHPEKMRLSLEYVREQSFWLDCKILLRTAWVVFLPGHSLNVAKSRSSENSGALADHS